MQIIIICNVSSMDVKDKRVIRDKIRCGKNGIRACKRPSWQRNSGAEHSREVGHRILSGGRTGAAFIPRPWPPSAWKFTTGSSRFTEAGPRAKRIKPRKRRDSAAIPFFHSRRSLTQLLPEAAKSRAKGSRTALFCLRVSLRAMDGKISRV